MNKKMGPLNVEIMGQLGDKLSSDVLTECKNIIEKIETQVISVLNKYKKYINQIGKELIKKETISYADIKKILPNKLENSLIIKLECHPTPDKTLEAVGMVHEDGAMVFSPFY